MLLLQVFQLGTGGLDCRLLLLVGHHVALEPVEVVDLPAQPGELLLGFAEGAAKAPVHPGVEGE